LNFPAADFEAVADRIVAAAQAMERDGWWWEAPGLTNRRIRRGILHEILATRFARGKAPRRPRAAWSVADR
jgi:glutamate-1-semialdehyde 2,1-aminomutase